MAKHGEPKLCATPRDGLRQKGVNGEEAQLDLMAGLIEILGDGPVVTQKGPGTAWPLQAATKNRRPKPGAYHGSEAVMVGSSPTACRALASGGHDLASPAERRPHHQQAN
jgi:hypothetical protein